MLSPTVDVRNAFNSLRWEQQLPFMDWCGRWDVKEGSRRCVAGRVPGPNFRDASYDGLHELDIPEVSRLGGHVDDVVPVCCWASVVRVERDVTFRDDRPMTIQSLPTVKYSKINSFWQIKTDRAAAEFAGSNWLMATVTKQVTPCHKCDAACSVPQRENVGWCSKQ